MNKRYMPDIHGLYKSQKNKKKQMSKESIENELIASGLSESDIEKLKSQAYASQYTFGYKKYNDFMVDINNTVTILNGKGFDVARNKTAQMEGIDHVLQSLTPLVNDVQQHLKKSQTGSKLIENALDVNFRFSNNPTRLSTSLATAMESTKKFDINKEFLYLDTETFSGQNEFGYQTLLGMQEFSVTKYKRVNGEVKEIAGSKIEALFGLDKTSIKDMEKINTITQWIEELETTGKMPGHSLAEVTLKRLAVEGHDNTKLDFGKNGIVRVSRYASPEIMKGKELNIDLIKKGLQKEISVGDYQRTVGRVGTEVLGDESITASTFEFFRYINELNTNFAMSKNGIAFDAKVLKQEAESRYRNLTDKQKEYIANKLGTKDFQKLTFAAGHLDQENLIKAAIDLYGEEKYFTPEQLAYAQSRGLTSRSLEGIARMLNEDGIYNTGKAAHTAGVDTFAGAFLAVGDYRDGKSFMEVIINDLETAYGNGSSLDVSNNVIKNKSGESLTPIFIAKKSDQFDSSPLDFSIDGLTGDIHFGNKKVMGVDGTVRDAVYSPAIKKNVAYEIKINKFNPNEEMLKNMQQIGDFYNGIDDLYIVSYIPQLDKDLAKGNEALISPIHRIVQGKDRVEANISNNMIYAFNKDSKGNYRELSVDDGVTEDAIKYAKENLAVYTTENGNRVIKQTTANEKVTKGTFDLMNDSAAREMRNTDLKKAQAFINVRNKFREQGYNTDREIKDRIGHLLSKTVSQGESLSLNAQDNMQINQLLAMVGYRHKGTGNNVLHPGTFKNFYNTFDVFSSMGETLDNIVDLSKQGGLDADLRYKEYIKNLRENIAEVITSDENIRSEFVTFMNGKGMNKTSEEIINGISNIENYGFDVNKFEFNISAKKFDHYNKNNANPEDIFTMDLDSGKHYSFINNLMNRHYGADKVKSMTAATKEAHAKKAIIKFMEDINSTEEYKGMFDAILKGEDYVTASKRIADIKAEKILKKNGLLSEINEVFNSTISNDKEVEELRNNLINARDNARVSRKEYFNEYRESLDIKSREAIDSNEDIRAIRDSLSENRQKIKDLVDKKNELIKAKNNHRANLKGLGNEFKESIYEPLEWVNLDPSERNSIKGLHRVIRAEQDAEIAGIKKINDELKGIQSLIDNAYEVDSNIYKELDEQIGKVIAGSNNKSYSEFIKPKRDNAQKEYEVLINKLDEIRASSKENIIDEFKSFVLEKNGELSDAYEILNNSVGSTELNSVSLAAKAQRAVRKFRENNPMAGLPSKTDMMNVISDADIIAFANSTQEGANIINRSLEESTKFLKNKKSKVISGEDIDREAEKIVDTVLNNVHINNKKVSDINEIAKHAANVYGYTERNIAIRVKHNRDAQIDMVKSIINTVHSVEGGSVLYNKNQIGIKIGNSEIVDITKYLPIMNFENGILSNKLNNSTLAAGEMISVADRIGVDGRLIRGENAITSTLNRGARDIKYLKNRIRTKDTDNSKIDTILYSLKRMGKNLRETSQVSIGNTYTEAINSVRRLDMREIQLAIPSLMDEIMRSQTLTEQQKKVLYNNKDRFAKFASDAEYDQIAAEVEPIIARMILGASENGDLNSNIDSHYLLKNFNLYVRDSQYEKFERAAGENEISAFQQLSNYKKPPIHQRRNAKLYRSKSIEEQSKINKKKDNTFNTITNKNRIVTEKERKLNNRKLSEIIDSTDTIMGNRLDIDDKTFKERLKAYKEELIKKNGKLSKEYEKGFEIASSMNLFEQEKIVNSRVSQMLFKDNDTQFINADSGIINTLINKEKDLKVTKELFEKQTQVVPIIKVDKNGKVTFKYGNKQLVSKHETLFTKEGFGGTVESIGANFDGLLGFRYYSANVALSESEITDYLNGLNITSPEEALEALNSRFSGKFAVENAVTKGMNKIYVDVEKGMGRSLEVGAGKINSNIANVLKKVGLENKVNSFIKEEYLEHVFNSIENIDEILKENGFSDIKDFMKALDKEKHLANDIVQSAFGNKGIAVFTNDAKIKHESLDMAVKDLLNTAALKKVNESGDFSEESEIKAYKEVYDIIKDSKAFSPYIEGFDEKTGQIITKSVDGTGHTLSLDDIKEVADNLGMTSEDGEILFGIKNEHGGQLVYSSFTVAGPGEYSGTSGSQGRLKTINEEIDSLRKKANLTDEEKIRLTSLEREKLNAASRNKLLTIDKRAARTLDIQSYNVTNKLNELESSLNREFLSDDGDVNLFKKYFMSMTERDGNGNVVLKDGVNHKTNAYLIDELKEKAVYNEDLEYLGGGYKKLDESYIKDLDSNDERNLIFKKYYGEGKGPISRNYAELAHASEQSTKALKFNGKTGGMKEKELLESGFTSIDINDLVQPTGPGSANFKGELNVPTGRSFILNLTDKNGRVSKIAVPYMPSKQVGDEEINTELNKAISSVANANKELQDFRANNLAGNATESQLQERLNNSISNLRTVIKDSAQTVEKELESVQLSDYKYNKASGILYHKNNKALNSSFYDTATFDGISLGKLADQDIYIPAAATGMDFFEEAGLLKESYYSKLGHTSREQMEEHLRTKGVVGLLGRNPQTEDLATSKAMIYLDDTRNSSEIKITGELLLAKNGDFDGDNLTLSLLEGGANQQRMHEMKKSILADTVELKAIRKNVLEPKIEKELKEANATFNNIFNNSATGANKNTFINMVDKNITADQVNEYKTITQSLINSIGNEKFKTYDFDKSFDSLMDAAKTTFTEGTEQYNKALEAINFSMAEVKQAMANISNSSKKDIGYMDTPLTELESMANALQVSADDMKAISSISKVMKEAPISKKHDASTELSITNRYRNAWKNAMTGSHSGAEEVLDIISTMKTEIVERAKTTDLAFSGISEMSEDEAFETLIKPVRRILDAGKTIEGQKAYLSEKKINESNAAAHTMKTRGSIFGEKIAELTNKKYVDEVKLSNLTEVRHSSYGFEKTGKRLAQDIGEAIQSAGTNNGFGLAKAALGVAAAVMMTGYIGGNPTVPADNHAEQMNNYDSLQDEDLSIQSLPQGTGQGYVININAQTPKGQEHAMQAIQKAVESSVTTDVNILMNINDKTSNISSRFIDKLLTGAL